MTATAYERIVDKLHDLDLRPRSSGSHQTVARCPSHDDRDPSFAVYDKEGRAKVVCFAGCNDDLDILPALDMTVADLYDERGKGRTMRQLDPEQEARRKARESMTLPQKALDDLVHTPGFAEKLCKTIARRRPELYLMDKREVPSAPNGALLMDPGFRHIAYLLGGGING